jgi:TonB family protein
MPPAAVLPPPIPQVVDATAAAGPAVKRGVPIALLAGGGGLVLLLGAIALGVALLRNRQPEASPTPAPTTLAAQPTPTAAPPSTTVAPVVVDGSLHVETQPAGATVTVDGVVRGVTPVDVAGLSIGTHQVKIEQKGFAVEEQSVEVTADAPAATINLALSKSGPAAGAADFTTNPPGAAVKLDGNPIGKTPLRNYKVRLGSHRYEPWSGNITVREGRKAKVDIFLKALPKATPVPTPTPDVVDPNRVYESGQVDTAPVKVGGTSATYPKGAPKLKEKVSVGGTVVVTDAGDVTDIRITESGGPEVDAAVTAAVRTWKFTPGVKKGIKVKVRMPFKQTFLPR